MIVVSGSKTGKPLNLGTIPFAEELLPEIPVLRKDQGLSLACPKE